MRRGGDARRYLSDLLAFAIHRRAKVEWEVLEAGGSARQGSGRLQRRGPQTTPSLCRDSDARVKGRRGRTYLGSQEYVPTLGPEPIKSQGLDTGQYIH